MRGDGSARPLNVICCARRISARNRPTLAKIFSLLLLLLTILQNGIIADSG